MATQSSNVSTGQQATAAQYNNLRTDAIRTIVKLASDVLKNSNDNEKHTSSLTYVKLKEIKLNAALDACRIKFDLKQLSGGAYSVKAQLYKNGIAFGTERTHTSTSYATYSEDFVDLASDDLIQLYVKRGDASAQDAYVRNLRLYYSDKITHMGLDELETEVKVVATAISTTNQDP